MQNLLLYDFFKTGSFLILIIFDFIFRVWPWIHRIYQWKTFKLNSWFLSRILNQISDNSNIQTFMHHDFDYLLLFQKIINILCLTNFFFLLWSPKFGHFSLWLRYKYKYLSVNAREYRIIKICHAICKSATVYSQINTQSAI